MMSPRAFAALALLLTASCTTETAPPAPPPQAGWAHCRDNPAQVVVYTKGDPEMRQAADQLRGDPEVGSLAIEDRLAAYERFKVMFKDQPELVKLARPEALPASVWVAVAPGVDQIRFADRLRQELTVEDEIVGNPCEHHDKSM